MRQVGNGGRLKVGIQLVTGKQHPGGILVVNRIKGQRSSFSARIAMVPDRSGPGLVATTARTCELSKILSILTQVVGMVDLLNFVMLICASVGSMAFGVLTAYAIFRLGFSLMRPRRQAVPMKAQPEVARVL